MSKDYEIGYGKPPKSGQFKKGKSGNPTGKPNGIKNLDTVIDEELSNKVLVKENGKKKKYPTRRLIIKALVTKAVKGDTRAALSLLKLDSDREGKASVLEPDVSETDQKILADYIANHLKSGEPQ